MKIQSLTALLSVVAASVGGVSLSPGSEIKWEAESGAVSSPFAVRNHPQASAGSYVVVPESDGSEPTVDSHQGSVTLTFETFEPNTYELWGKVFTPGQPREREDSFYVEIDGKRRIWRIRDWADNWVWRRMKGENPVDKVLWQLGAGKHELKIFHRVAGTWLDQLKLVPAENSARPGKSPDDFVAADQQVYKNLSPYFDMPDLTVPQFPEREYSIDEFGAVGDGVTLNTRAIQRAIDACSGDGGGRVIVPEGEWLTGSIHMKSFVNLHLREGAVLKFSRSFEDYLPVVFTRWEGMECYNYSAPIYGYGLRNIAITGKGLIDGQGDFWWDWKKRQGKTAKQLYEMCVAGVPPTERILGTVEAALRPNFVQFIACSEILIENVTFRNGPMWTVHPVYCSNMIVRGMKVITVGPNNDGINPDSSRNILIEDCYFSTGDDCVVLKSGLNEDGWRVDRPTENVVVRRIFAHEGHGGVVVGSEMSGSVRNVYAHDCEFDGTDRGFRVKSMRGRGGVVEDIWIENIRMRNMGGQAIRLNMFYSSSTVIPKTERPAAFRRFYIRDIECDGAARAIEITGLPELAIEDIHLENIRIRANEGIKITDGLNLVIEDLELSTGKGTPIELNNVRSTRLQGVIIDSDEPTWIQINGDRSHDIRVLELHDRKMIDQRIQSEIGTDSYELY